MRFHVVSLPHTQTTSEYLQCAYTQKVVKFCRMMKDRGHTVFLYASEENEAPCDELIPCITKGQQKALMGVDHYVKIPFDANHPLWKAFSDVAIPEINKRKQTGDFLCLITGTTHKPIADAVGMTTVEFGVGYTAMFAPFRVYESYAWMHAVYAQYQDASRADGRFYDAVIPNYFDPADFPESPIHEDYLLFVGRMVQRKGLKIVEDIANRTKRRVIMAGMGARQEGERIICQDIEISSPYIQYVGEIDAKRRGELMSHAHAVLAPSIYMEPFCGVAVEAMLCGTPVITTDWGAFTETVQNGFNGFRCRTLAEFCDAVDKAGDLHKHDIRSAAVAKYSLDVVGLQYEQYFQKLLTLNGKGWYT